MFNLVENKSHWSVTIVKVEHKRFSDVFCGELLSNMSRGWGWVGKDPLILCVGLG